MERAVLAGGCFWGMEDLIRKIPGVRKTRVGYTGGHLENPTYQDVCTETTGHAEAIEIFFDPSKLTFRRLLEFFFQIHDPTTLNQQGPDRGSQYRSLIGFYDDSQEKVATEITKRLNDSQFNQKITTVIEPVKNYCPAEEYHQKYIEKKYSFLNV